MPPALFLISSPSISKQSVHARTNPDRLPYNREGEAPAEPGISKTPAQPNCRTGYPDCADPRLNDRRESATIPSETSPAVPDWNLRCMLLQTNSYVVPKEKRSEHARLLRRFKQVLHK